MRRITHYRLVLARLAGFALLGLGTAAIAQDPPAAELEYYPQVTWSVGDHVMEVGGLEVMPDGRVMIATRRGEMFIAENPTAKDGQITFKPFAFGLAQPLGVSYHDGAYYVAQRGELTRIVDTNGDDQADVFETLSDGWEISGSYHEYNFGPRMGPDGQFWVTLNKPFGSEKFGRARWRGWAVRVSLDGKMEGMAMGLRSPAGMEFSPWGELFYTDNQGEWCNASKLSLIKQGDFHGHPHSQPDTEQADSPIRNVPKPISGTPMNDVALQIPRWRMPAVWLPYRRIGQSPAGMAWDQSKGKYGPFAGQLFVGDQHSSLLMRVALEKVNGHWQGAAFHHRKGLQCGVIRVRQLPDGSMLTGQSERGWGALGAAPFGVQRVFWSGKVPFEMHTVHARPDGFEITFTEPVAPSAAKAASWKIKSYTYNLRSNYGGPDENVAELAITGVQRSANGKSLRLTVDGLRQGYVHEIVGQDVTSAGGTALLHPEAWYTLAEIPGNPTKLAVTGTGTPGTGSEPGATNFPTLGLKTVGEASAELTTADGEIYVPYKANGAAIANILGRRLYLASGSLVVNGEAQAPSMPAVDKDGWNHLRVNYQRSQGKPMITRIYLNQRLIHQAIPIADGASTALSIKGPVEIGRITHRPATPEKVVTPKKPAPKKPGTKKPGAGKKPPFGPAHKRQAVALVGNLLHANSAVVSGGASYETRADRQCVGLWESPQAKATWPQLKLQAGTYAVAVRQSLDGKDKSDLTVTIGSTKLSAKTKNNGDWGTFVDVPAGTYVHKADGPVDVSVQGSNFKNKYLFNLRGVVFTPQK